jgi:hypothetical protein
MKDQPRNAKSLIRATMIETLVMQEFVRNIGLIEPHQFGTNYEKELSSTLLHTWLVLESVFFSRMHCGQNTKKLYYVDESYIKLNDDYLFKYYNSNGSIRDPDLVARSSFPLLGQVLESVKLLEATKIDEHETAALLVLLLLRNGRFFELKSL